MDEVFVTLYVGIDPIEVDLLEQRLRGEGLTVRVQGVRNAAAVGAAPHLFELTVEVAERDHERAAEITEEFLHPEPLEAMESLPEELREEDDEDGDAVSGPSVAAPERLKPLFAAGVMLFFPGACHLYARRPWTALLVAVGEVAGFVALADGSWDGWMVGVILLFGMLLADLVGGQLAVRAWNRGVRVGAGRQVLRGSALLLLLGALAFTIGPRIPWSPPNHDDDNVPGYLRYDYDIDFEPYPTPLPGSGEADGTGLRLIYR